MNSRTKHRISAEMAAEMTRRAFDTETDSVTVQNAPAFHTAFQISLKTGGRVVLKAAPPDDTPLPRFAKGSLAAEAAALARVADIEYFPAPHVLFFDSSRELYNGDYLFMEEMPGRPFAALLGTLPPALSLDLYTQMGVYAHKLGGIAGGFFGSLTHPERQFDTWGAAFCAMVSDVLLDASDLCVSLGLSFDRIRKRVLEAVPLFDLVKKPSLVHRSLGTANVLVDPHAAEITGIVNFDRAIFGDTLMEPVFGRVDRAESFLCSYNAGESLDEKQRLRMTFYKIYLAILATVEASNPKIADRARIKDGLSLLDTARAEYRALCKEAF